MFLHRKINLSVDPSLDEEEVDDENTDLKEFYESNLPHLFNCPWNLITYPLVRQIAIKIDETKSSREDWRKYATEMGIDNETITEIMIKAHCKEDQEMFIAMDVVVRKYGTFGHIILALLKTHRFDVLQKIEPTVRSLLSKISLKNEGDTKDPSNMSTCFINCKDENFTEEHCIKKNFVPSSAQKYETDYFQQHSIKSNFKSGLQISDSSKLPGESLGDAEIPSAPVEEKITVLIPHAESKRNVAEELSAKFGENGVFATTLSEVNNWTHFGFETVLNTIFREVDFIVPIVCSGFLNDISHKDHEQYLESEYAKHNSYLYELIKEEYCFNRYVNTRVRPVIVPEMNRRSIREPIFKFSFRLPEEVPKLIQVLRDTKDLFRNTTVGSMNK